MREDGSFGWRNRWVRGSVCALVALMVVSILVGFVWLPSVQGDFSAQGLWGSICRAAGVPSSWASGDATIRGGPLSTSVVLERSMAEGGPSDSIGRGATLALNCTMCHGAQGLSQSDAPNLAGQYAEVIIKQLHDYKAHQRASTIMEGLAQGLSDRDMRNLADYYAYLPKARTAPTTYGDALPALVRVGDPMRNVAPCISCHGSVDQKLGAPWLEGMPKAYLVEQLKAFESGARRNDAEAQMRNMARTLTGSEIDQVAGFYARKATPPETR